MFHVTIITIIKIFSHYMGKENENGFKINIYPKPYPQYFLRQIFRLIQETKESNNYRLMVFPCNHVFNMNDKK